MHFLPFRFLGNPPSTKRGQREQVCAGAIAICTTRDLLFARFWKPPRMLPYGDFGPVFGGQPPMRPQRKRRASRVPRAARGECEGRPGGRWFSGLFSGRPAPSLGKEPGKASRPLPGKRVPRQAAVARLGPSWKRGVRPGREAGRGIPKGPSLGAGPGRREPRSLRSAPDQLSFYGKPASQFSRQQDGDCLS